MYGDPFLPGYEPVYTIGDSASYEWAEFRVFKKDGRLFAAGSGGCSCNYYEENVIESDLIELPTLEAARNAVKNFLSNSYHFSDQITPYLDAVEKFRELGLR